VPRFFYSGVFLVAITLIYEYRMRNATICLINLKGVATEVIKNIVLAGIGRLIVVDSADVQEQDLGAGFFFRDEDVKSKVCD